MSSASSASSRRQVTGCAAALAAAILAAYSGTVRSPMVFDDVPSIVDNPSIRNLGTALFPVARSTVSGRPVLNASFALNYAAGGLHVWGYHAVNLAIHIAAALVLFGLVRRTLERRALPWALPAAFSVALVWGLHPLLTGSVTYIVQRAESLMGLFFLLALYAFARSADADGGRRRAWICASASACLLGMGTKEVMAAAPLVILLYDRTFVAGSFRAALRARPAYYGFLAATWAALAGLVISTGGRGGTAGFEAGVSAPSYAVTQLGAVVHYLRLSFWPRGLVFDYGGDVAAPSIHAAACGLALLALVSATLWALVRRPVAGFLGSCFFAILAPSSSVVPVVTETMAEHRMYLPLIPVVVLVVVGLYRWLGRTALAPCLLAGCLLGWATWDRNQVYGTEKALWSDTAEKLPGNERAQNNLGNMLAREPGHLDEAVARYREALRLQPGYGDAHYNLGVALGKLPGRSAEALSEFEEAVRLEPDSVEAQNNLGDALARAGRPAEAVPHLEAALRLDPDHAGARYNLGNALSALGRTREAAANYEKALVLEPGRVEAQFNLGNAYVALGRNEDAAARYAEAARLRPGYAEADYNLGNVLLSMGRPGDAASAFEAAVKAKPGFADAQFNLGLVLLKLPGKRDEAIAHLREARRLQPDNPGAAELLDRLGASAR